MNVITILCVVATVLLGLASQGAADCCYRTKTEVKNGKNNGFTVDLCADCSRATPYCSRTGSCNMFGCNCDGGCKQGKACNLQINHRTGRDVIATHDIDGDGRLSLDEASYPLNMAAGGDVARMKRSFWELDVDQDSFLTAQEIDPEY